MNRRTNHLVAHYRVTLAYIAAVVTIGLLLQIWEAKR